ncbi:hypothetical protein MJO28_001839 [Puccinia striiformis f. sp. tritici]|uniref:Uncharacterized protein n=1 Tax=Puccinia striiformis f. sp. tritici TaxID=168172 RepID=A0ACC0EUN7_9BASI|nr:hypothetical protein MJO28_001839 [Puccinia striiformis f. sp. tritici]
MKIISISSNGAANELPAQMEVVNLSDSHLIPLVGCPPLPLVGIQDPKHARKTSVNQLLSGACLLCFGKFWFSILHLSVIVKCKNSPLYVKDAFNSGKQDNGWAYRVLHEDTLKIVLETEDCTGLAIYLFVLEELCDSWRWHDYLPEQDKSTNSVMSFNHKIFSTLADSLLSLIISHQEYYPEIPLMPWKHGTEACEHIFGRMRVILPNFTADDANIFVIIKSIMTGKVQMPKSEHVHSGWLHCFFHLYCCIRSDNRIQLNCRLPILFFGFGVFPSNKQVNELLKLAEKRAKTLIEFAGMQEVPGEESGNLSLDTSGQHEESHELLETETVQTSRMAIHNLLNPQPSEVQIPMSVVDLFDFECQVSTKWITDTQHLHCNNLLRHLHNHDSEVLVHHGHKHKRCKNIIN